MAALFYCPDGLYPMSPRGFEAINLVEIDPSAYPFVRDGAALIKKRYLEWGIMYQVHAEIGGMGLLMNIVCMLRRD